MGSTVKVQVEEVKSDGKMVLSMKMENRAEVRYSNSGVRVDDALCVCFFSLPRGGVSPNHVRRSL